MIFLPFCFLLTSFRYFALFLRAQCFSLLAPLNPRPPLALPSRWLMQRVKRRDGMLVRSNLQISLE